jgi:hypothetical protein
MNFKRNLEPFKAMGIGYGKKLDTKAWKVIEFIKSKGEEGASFTEIQRYVFVDLNGGSEEDFWKTSPQSIWVKNGVYRETPMRNSRGFWKAQLTGSGPGRQEGILPKFCYKNNKGKWVLKRMPKPGENLIENTNCLNRAKFINESQNFERGQEPIQAMGIGKYRNKQKVLNFFRWVSEDYQLNEDDPDYLGYLNISEDDIQDNNIKEGFIEFVKTYPLYVNDMTSMGLDTEEFPQLEETVFVKLERLEEAQNFERGTNPIKSMGIGMKSQSIEIDHLEYRRNEDIIEPQTSDYILSNLQNYIFGVYIDLKDGEDLEFAGVFTPNYFIKNFSNRFKYYYYNGNYYKLTGGKVLSTNESQNFERGGDPLKTMDIGMSSKYPTIIEGWWREDGDIESNKLSSYQIKRILKNPKISNIRRIFKKSNKSKIYVWFLSELKKEPGYYNLSTLKNYPYVYFEDKIYQINPYVTESQNFERGGNNPLNTMGVGIKSQSIEIKQIEFKGGNGRVPEERKDYILNNLQEFKDKIYFYFDLPGFEMGAFTPSWFIKNWSNRFKYYYWNGNYYYITGGRVKVNESQNFERSGEPISSMDIGLNRKNFNSWDDFLSAFILKIPEILGTKKIPEDILQDYSKVIKSVYYLLLDNYLEKAEVRINGTRVWFLNWTDALEKKLWSMGYDERV